MSDSWPTFRLSELVEKGEVSYGVVQPGSHTADGVPIVRVKDVRNGIVDVSAPLRVAPDVARRYSRTTLRGGELLVSIVGTVGEAAVAPASLAGWNVARAIAVIRPTTVSPEWIRLCLRTSPVRNALDAGLNTTVQATLNLADLKRLKIPVPPGTQRDAIVDVLGALDDKIAANDRTTKLAGSLADAEFARAASHVLADSATFEQVAEIGGGGTPKTSVEDYWNGGICWATPTDVTGLEAPYLSRTSRTITEEGLAACSSRLYPVGSILMTSRATIGAFAVARVPTAVNQGFIVVNARDRTDQWWLFHEMRARIDEFLSHANGATFLELPRGRFKKLEVRKPTAELARAFAAKVEPLHGIAAQLMTETETLAATRDELLPLLMSGRIRVRDAEKVVEEVT